MHNTTKNIKLKVLTHKISIKNTQPNLLFTKHSAIIPHHIKLPYLIINQKLTTISKIIVVVTNNIIILDHKT